MTRFRLSPFVRLIPSPAGLLFHSDRGTFALDGINATSFASLVNGSQDNEDFIATYGGDKIAALAVLDGLQEHGLIEEVLPNTGDQSTERWAPQERFLERGNGEWSGATQRLSTVQVLLAGLEPWGLVAAVELAASGLGRLHVLDDGYLASSDLLAVPMDTSFVGRPRAEAVQCFLSQCAPWCTVTRGPFSSLGLSEGPWDLVVASLNPDDLPALRALALFAHRHRFRSLYSAFTGKEVQLGPLVIPGQTACWNCCNARLLGDAEHPADEYLLQTMLLHSQGDTLRSWPGPLPSILGGLLAFEAVSLLCGDAHLQGQLLVQDMRTLEATLHPVLPLPWCEVCGGARSLEIENAPHRGIAGINSSEDLCRALPGWIDRRTGVIRHVMTNSCFDPDFRVPVCAVATLAAYTDGTAPPVQPGHGYGKGLCIGEALISAVGEALEHYSAGRVRVETLRSARLCDLSGEVLNPHQLCLYTEDQYGRPDFPFVSYDATTPLLWTQGYWLDSGEPVWIPAAAVYLSPSIAKDVPICQATSNGLATGANAEDAALRAVLELVERDAFLISWLARRPGRRLLLDRAMDPGIDEVLGALRDCGAQIEFYLVDVGFSIPTAVCLALGCGKRWPGVTLGLGTDLSPGRAVRKAILELGQTGPYLRRLMLESEERIPQAPEQVKSFRDHALYYLPPERVAAFDFFRSSGEEPCRLGSLPEPSDRSLTMCIAHVAAAGVRMALVDVTAPDVALSPFRVVRAVGTNLQQVSYGWGLEHLGNPRLRTLLTGPTNPHPHPLC